MVDCYVGEIRVMAGIMGGHAPDNWVMCDGSLLQVSQFQALFALLGTTYGGDGVNTFGLPDLRSRLPMGDGSGPGLTPRVLGNKGGSETATLTAAMLPSHTHSLNTAGVDATSPTVASTVTFANVTGQNVTYVNATLSSGTPTVVKPDPTTVSNTGAGQPHANIMPGMGLYYIIATNGIFPTQA